MNDFLGVLGFTSSGFTTLTLALLVRTDSRDEDTLRFPLFSNLLPSPLGNCVDMRRVLLSTFGAVLGDDPGGVDGQVAIRIKRYQEQSIHQLCLIDTPQLDYPEYVCPSARPH